MPLFNANNKFQQVFGQVSPPTAGGGTETTVKANEDPKAGRIDAGPLGFITGLSLFNGNGEGNTTAGLAGAALAGGAQQAGMPASFGYEFGKKASGPWEAFIGGGWEANKRGFSGDNLFIPQDPLTNQLVGGLAGLAGFLF